MTVKCTGAEFLRFYNDKDWWFSSDAVGADHSCACGRNPQGPASGICCNNSCCGRKNFGVNT